MTGPAAERRRRDRWRRPGSTLVLVALLLAAVLGAATAAAPPPPPEVRDQGQRLVPIARDSGACADPVVAAGTTTDIAVAAPGLDVAGVGDAPDERAGRAELRAPDGTPLSTVVAPGSAVASAPAGEGPVVVRAGNASAPGLATTAVTRSTEATMRGLAGAWCASSATEFWFVGSGAVVGQRGRVYLTNPEAAPAVVDVTLYGPDGQIDAPDGRGVAVAPGEQEVRLLDALAPGTTRFAVHVRARQGRVSAAVRDTQVDGLVPLGADWVPAAVAPARRVLVPGVVGGTGPRLLRIVAPGDADAIVRIRLLSDSGPFAPSGLDVVEVPAGTVSEVDLAEATAGEAVTVELRADEPVTAGVLSTVTGAAGQLSEIAYAAAGAAATPERPAVVPDLQQGEGVSSTVYLTAVDAPVVADLVPLPPAVGDPVEVSVAAGAQVPVLAADLGSTATFAVVVTPRSGRLLVVRQVDEAEERGPFVTSSPVPPGRFVVPVPQVVADLSTGLRAGG